MNDGFEYREQVGAEAGGRSVLAHLTARYRHSSEAVWRERIAAGEVELAGERAAAGDVMRAGQRLVWKRPPWEEPAAPLAFAVLYLDPALVAVAKPRGLPSLPAGGYLTHTLLHRVGRVFPGAIPLHRLGRGTSGLVLFARTRAAGRVLSAAWREGRVEKVYRARVSGIPARSSFSVDIPIGRVAHPRLGQVHAASRTGRAAVTHVRVLDAGEGDALVEATIPTGRPHQIRIHMAAAGHPLKGDPLYVAGGVPGPDPGLPGDPGYRLHAQRLAFDHPETGRPLVLECAPPPDLLCPGPGPFLGDRLAALRSFDAGVQSP